MLLWKPFWVASYGMLPRKAAVSPELEGSLDSIVNAEICPSRETVYTGMDSTFHCKVA